MTDWAELYTDGACKGNPGRGGWGALLIYGDMRLELFGGDADTTNNRMELTAVIKGLEALPNSCKIRVTTDSTYVAESITKFVEGWRSNSWHNASNRPVKNCDLWKRLYELVSQQQQVEWIWVRGHNGHPENELADKLANMGVLQVKHDK